MSVENKVKKIIAEKLGVEIEKVVPEASFIDDLGADSLQSVELVASFEEEFQIEMEEDKALEIQTVADAVKFISQYLK